MSPRDREQIVDFETKKELSTPVAIVREQNRVKSKRIDVPKIVSKKKLAVTQMKPKIPVSYILLNQLENQSVMRKVKFKCVNESDLNFQKFGFNKLKEMSKDDDVETEDYLVTSTQRSVLKNLKEAVSQYMQLKSQA